MKGRSLLIILCIVSGLGYIGRTLVLSHLRQEKKQAQERMIKGAKAVSKFGGLESIQEQNAENIKNINDSIKDIESTESKIGDIKFEEYIPVDGIYSLAKIEKEYYIVEIATQNLRKIEEADIARVCYIKNENDDSEFNAIFIHRADRWYLIDFDENILSDLEDIEVLENSKFVIRGGELLLAE